MSTNDSSLIYANLQVCANLKACLCQMRRQQISLLLCSCNICPSRSSWGRKASAKKKNGLAVSMYELKPQRAFFYANHCMPDDVGQMTWCDQTQPTSHAPARTFGSPAWLISLNRICSRWRINSKLDVSGSRTHTNRGVHVYLSF